MSDTEATQTLVAVMPADAVRLFLPDSEGMFAHPTGVAVMSLNHFGVRAHRVLNKLKAHSPFDLSRFYEHEVLGLKGVGPTTLHELREYLRGHGLQFRNI